MCIRDRVVAARRIQTLAPLCYHLRHAGVERLALHVAVLQLAGGRVRGLYPVSYTHLLSKGNNNGNFGEAILVNLTIRTWHIKTVKRIEAAGK